MNIAIRYFTKSKKGNTKKMADAVSKALGIESLDISNNLSEKVDRLFLINAMYAANIDNEVKEFLKRNADKILELVNINTSATGASTYSMVKKVSDELGINLSDKHFHCKGSWLMLNQEYPRQEDLDEVSKFVKELV